ncbi:MAG: GyrI-like domain-containing protein [Oscillospiraceae bacterium]|nr:GyrI-like domain-containing protein [Oscillospiraceae bacterium]
MEQNIVVKTVTLEPVRIYSLRKKMSLKDFDEVFTTLYATAARQKLGIAGPPITIYHDEEFDPEHSDIEVGVPVTGSGDGVRTLEGGLCCYATHIGPYDAQFSSIYAALTEWIDANGYTLNGPPYDKYVRGYSDEGLPPSEFVTEVYFPIRQK